MHWHRGSSLSDQRLQSDALALAAVEMVESGMKVGLGAGRTAARGIAALAERVKERRDAPRDDVLSYSPAPDPFRPALNPITATPDFRAGHSTYVRAQLTFTRVMDPRTFRTGRDGTLRLEFNVTMTRPGNSFTLFSSSVMSRR